MPREKVGEEKHARRGRELDMMRKKMEVEERDATSRLTGNYTIIYFVHLFICSVHFHRKMSIFKLKLYLYIENFK